MNGTSASSWIEAATSELAQPTKKQKQDTKKLVSLLTDWQTADRQKQKELQPEIEALAASLPEIVTQQLYDDHSYIDVIALEKLEDAALEDLKQQVAEADERYKQDLKQRSDLSNKITKLKAELKTAEQQYRSTGDIRNDKHVYSIDTELRALEQKILITRYVFPDIPTDLSDEELKQWLDKHMQAIGFENLRSDYRQALQSVRYRLKKVAEAKHNEEYRKRQHRVYEEQKARRENWEGWRV